MNRQDKQISLFDLIEQEELERLSQKSLEELSRTCAWGKSTLELDRKLFGPLFEQIETLH